MHYNDDAVLDRGCVDSVRAGGGGGGADEILCEHATTIALNLIKNYRGRQAGQ